MLPVQVNITVHQSLTFVWDCSKLTDVLILYVPLRKLKELLYCVSFLLDETMNLEMMSGFKGGTEIYFEKFTDYKIDDSKNNNNNIGEITYFLSIGFWRHQILLNSNLILNKKNKLIFVCFQAKSYRNSMFGISAMLSIMWLNRK